jgi:hypothetical protein
MWRAIVHETTLENVKSELWNHRMTMRSAIGSKNHHSASESVMRHFENWSAVYCRRGCGQPLMSYWHTMERSST